MAAVALHRDQIATDVHAKVERVRFLGLDTADTVTLPAPGVGKTWVLIGWKMWQMSTDALFRMEDGDETSKLSYLFVEAVDNSGRVYMPRFEPGEVWVPVGDNQPVELGFSAGTGSGVVYFVEWATARAFA